MMMRAVYHVALVSLTLTLGGMADASAFTPAVKAPKKTLCTLTINSVQEKDLFRKFLPKEDFQVVELVPETAPGLAWIESWNQQSWFKKACEKRVQCDVLVVSGHFAGQFFGRSGYSLGLDAMERASCDRSCDGIFKRPKEVYLFGCNTLADKSRDQRSPEEYVRVLRADGFSTEEAYAVAMQRYTPWGASNADRMRSLFPNAAGLYGFNSVSPLGKNIEAPLGNYLKTRGPRYAKELESLKPGDRNLGLATALKSFSYTQAEPNRGESPLVCQLTTPAGNLRQTTIDHTETLIFKELTSETPLKNLPQILEKLRDLSVTHPEVLTRLRQHLQSEARDYRSSYIKMFESAELRAHLSIRLGLIELLKMIYPDGPNDTTLETRYRDVLRSELMNVSEHSVRDLCQPALANLVRSYELPVGIVEAAAKKFEKSKAKTQVLFGALSCLRTEVSLTWLTNSFPSSFLFAQIWNLQFADLKARLVKSKDAAEQNRLLGLLLASPFEDAEVEGVLSRRLANPLSAIATMKVLSESSRIDELWQLHLVERTRFEGDEDEMTAWIVFWRQLRPSAASVQTALHDRALKFRDNSFLLSVFSANSLNGSVLANLLKSTESGEASERSFNLSLLTRLSPEGDGLYQIGLRLLQDPDSRVRFEAASLILRFFSEAQDVKLELRMRQMLSEKSEDILGSVLRFWAKRGTKDEVVLQRMDDVWQKSAPDSDLRSLATDVFQHLELSSVALIQKMEARLADRPDGESRAQLEKILAGSNWDVLNSAGATVVQTRLSKYFEALSRVEDDDKRVVARKALLRNTKVSASFLKASTRDLDILLRAQNWIGARELAFELENYRGQKDIDAALGRFQRALENSLDGDL